MHMQLWASVKRQGGNQRRHRRYRHRRKGFVNHGEYRHRIDIACHRDNHVTAYIMLAPEFDQGIAGKTRHRGFTASNIASQRLIAPQMGIKQQVHQFGGTICRLADFFDDDLALFFDIR